MDWTTKIVDATPKTAAWLALLLACAMGWQVIDLKSDVSAATAKIDIIEHNVRLLIAHNLGEDAVRSMQSVIDKGGGS